MKKYNFVYRTINIVNSKIYIGVHSTDNLSDGYLGSGVRFKLAIKKYGKESFIREVLYYFNEINDCFIKESQIVDFNFIKMSNVYNLTVGGISHYTPQDIKDKISKSHKGKVLSKEHKKKLSDSHKGKLISEETRQKISKSNKGRIVTNETRQKISDANKGDKNPNYNKTTSKDTKEKISNSLKEYYSNNISKSKGVKLTGEHKLKLSIANSGVNNPSYGKPSPKKNTKISQDVKDKISRANKGKIFTYEHKKKLSDSHKGKKLSEEHIRNLIDKNGKYWKDKKLSDEHKLKIRLNSSNAIKVKLTNLDNGDVNILLSISACAIYLKITRKYLYKLIKHNKPIKLNNISYLIEYI